MSDLISRQDAIDAIDRLDIPEDMCVFEIMSHIEVEIATLPSAERRGQWIRHDEIKNVYGGICIECSECDEKYVVQHIEDEKYCRNCGAKMQHDASLNQV